MKIPSWLRGPSRVVPPSFDEIARQSAEYLRERTLVPLKGVAHTLIYGLAGAVFLGSGFVLCLIGLLRILQGETSTTFAGGWSFVPYLLTAAAGLLVMAESIYLGLRRYRRRSNI